MRWLAWVRTGNYENIDHVLAKPAVYGTKAHLVAAPVGGYKDQGNGQSGKAVCGVVVPEDDPGTIMYWTDGLKGAHDISKLPKCSKCLAQAARWLPSYRIDGGLPLTLAELKRDNPDGVGVDWAVIEAMEPGEKLTLGGGAWAETELERL